VHGFILKICLGPLNILLFSAPAAAVAEKAEVAAEVTATGAMTAMATAEATEAARRRGGRRRPTTGEVGPPGVTTDLDPDLIHHVSILKYC
jgi:hypothetical protein